MIRAQIHETTLDGFPMDETGTIVEGNDAYEAVEAMKMKSPFTVDMSIRQYIDFVLGKVAPKEKTEDVDATEFLARLAGKGFISFLPDEINSESMEEVSECADKQA